MRSTRLKSKSVIFHCKTASQLSLKLSIRNFPNVAVSALAIHLPRQRGGGNSLMKRSGVLVISRGSMNQGFWDPFLESPGNFSCRVSHSKIAYLPITELFYLHILYMDRG